MKICHKIARLWHKKNIWATDFLSGIVRFDIITDKGRVILWEKTLRNVSKCINQVKIG